MQVPQFEILAKVKVKLDELGKFPAAPYPRTTSPSEVLKFVSPSLRF